MNKDFENNILNSEKKYSQDWSEHLSLDLEKSGIYDWFLQECITDSDKVILELGTGDGKLTEKLFKNDRTIISVDYNSFCLDIAENRLKVANIPYIRIGEKKLQKEEDNNLYSSTFKVQNNTFFKSGCVNLLNYDFCQLEDFIGLFKEINFDVVLCLNIGSNSDRIWDSFLWDTEGVFTLDPELFKKDSLKHEYMNLFEANMYARRCAFFLAKKLLVLEGKFFISDRLSLNEENIKEIKRWYSKFSIESSLKNKKEVEKEFTQSKNENSNLQYFSLTNTVDNPDFKVKDVQERAKVFLSEYGK